MSRPVLIAGRRSAIGKYKGGLTPVRADDLAATVLAELWQDISTHLQERWVDDIPHPQSLPSQGQAPLPEGEGVELILGCANQAGEDSRNVARQVGLLAGLPPTIPAVTVNQLCGSSLAAVIQGARAIRCGEASLVLAGGLEHMSRAPLAQLPPWVDAAAAEESTVFGWRFVNQRFVQDPALQGYYLTMVEAAEYTAQTLGISRECQEAVALISHQRGAASQQAGHFADSLTPVHSPNPRWANRDEGVRSGLSAAQLQRLPLLISGGSITAGTAAAYGDGAAWLAMMDQDKMPALPISTVALEIIATASIACEPREMGLAPVTAIRQVLAEQELSLKDIDLMEWHEAFAATHLVCCQALGLDWQDPRLNRWGGSLALGAPMGMLGARLLVTLLDRFRDDLSAQWGLVALPVGMGQGQAVLVRRWEE